MSDRIIYFFGNKTADGDAKMKYLLGGKGANLAEISKIGIAVPPGFTITTDECKKYYKVGNNLSEDLLSQIDAAMLKIETLLGNGMKFGDENNPLLVSVRSGAPFSMPGMMDTILNLGLNDKTVAGLALRSQNERFAFDSYRRFIQMYSDVVLGVDHAFFESILDDAKLVKGIILDTDLTAADLKNIVKQYKDVVLRETGSEFPQDTKSQLLGAIEAVFRSWMNDRAIYYRRMHEIPDNVGTAVNIQSMVFGNLGNTSGTGVAFTRNPSTGENKLYGEYLLNAQGEDVVAGIRTPYPIDNASKTPDNSQYPSLEDAMPSVYSEFVKTCAILEEHYKDMQDIEFTIQDSKLWILQTRNGKRTAKAAIKVAVDLVAEDKISKNEALKRIDPKSLDQLLHRSLDPKAPKTLLDTGLPASPGAASGCIVFSCEGAVAMVKQNKKAILVRVETSPEDIEGMNIADGILTSRGGMTSHAAVVARGMGKTCVTSARNLQIDDKKKEIRIGNKILTEGDIITINGSDGNIYLGEVATIEPEFSEEFKVLMSWADAVRNLKVRTNAETPLDASTAIKFGAEGIGLCRTEHMFFNKDRILHVRQMILATTTEDRQIALGYLLPYQTNDFLELFKIMNGLPVNIRLLDPPLHEFLPHTDEEMKELASLLKISPSDVSRRTSELHEQNPMLGHRGCRLGITYPEIYKMQVLAIFEAAYSAMREGFAMPLIEIMVPFIFSKAELDILKTDIDHMAQFVTQKYKNEQTILYSVGTMIELPRAALMAGDIAKTAEYFSFGTNDLTQTTLGISRDDSSFFMRSYQERGIVEVDPFAKLDENGVGKLIEIAITEGKKTRPNIKTGICGEHGGDPASIKFCAKVGMNYVSCSPYRVPIARLAAAIAELE